MADHPRNKDKIFLKEWLDSGGEPGRDYPSPIAREMDFRLLDINEGEGRVRATVTFSDNHLTGAGIISGGLTVTAVDFAMAMVGLLFTDDKQALATTNLEAQFLKPARPGIYEVEARLESRTGRTLFLAGALRKEDQGAEVLTAQAIFKILGSGT